MPQFTYAILCHTSHRYKGEVITNTHLWAIASTWKNAEDMAQCQALSTFGFREPLTWKVRLIGRQTSIPRIHGSLVIQWEIVCSQTYTKPAVETFKSKIGM